MNIISSYRESVREFKSLRTNVLCALLIAMGVVLEPFTLHFTDEIRQSFGFLPLSIIGMMFGPFVGGIAGAVGDIVKYFVNPTGAFFPGFTLNEFFTGTVYGLLLYKKKISFERCFIVRFIIIIAANIFMTPLWLYVIGGGDYWVRVIARIPKNAVVWPITSVMMYFALKGWDRVWTMHKKGN